MVVLVGVMLKGVCWHCSLFVGAVVWMVLAGWLTVVSIQWLCVWGWGWFGLRVRV